LGRSADERKRSCPTSSQGEPSLLMMRSSAIGSHQLARDTVAQPSALCGDEGHLPSDRSVEAAASEDEPAPQRPGAVEESREKAAAALNGKILRAEARISMTLLHRLILGSDGVVDHQPIERGGRRPANDALVHRIVGELRIAAAEQT